MVLARKCVVGPLLYFNIDNQDLTLARFVQKLREKFKENVFFFLICFSLPFNVNYMDNKKIFLYPKYISHNSIHL